MSEGIQKLLDNGQIVVLFRNGLNTYTSAAIPVLSLVGQSLMQAVDAMEDMALTHTDDKTPSKSLHRLSEKMLRTGDYADWPSADTLPVADLAVGDRVEDRHGNVGTISKIHSDFWIMATEFLTMTGQEWLEKQLVPFTEEQITQEVWFTVSVDGGGAISSPRSCLTKHAK